MKKIFLLLLFCMGLSYKNWSQTTCFSGAMSIYDQCNNGQGCTNNCNLTEFNWYGSMCNGSFYASNCFGASGGAGQQTLNTTFSIPSGCTATVVASFLPRCNGNGCSNCGSNCNYTGTGSGSGCGNSGLDNGDKLLVGGNSTSPVYTNTNATTGSPTVTSTTNASGYTLTAIGSSNSGVIIEYAQTGGTMFVGMSANRSDEIVTFTLIIQSGCNCSNVLPVDIYSFYGVPKKGMIELNWLTRNEQDLLYYKIDKSTDGVHYSTLTTISSENTYKPKIYSTYDDNPIIGTSYYKLTPVKKNGSAEKSILIDVNYQLEYIPFKWRYQDDDVIMEFYNFDIPTSFIIQDLSGNNVFKIEEITETIYHLDKTKLSKGLYLGVLQNRYNTYYYKMIIL